MSENGIQQPASAPAQAIPTWPFALLLLTPLTSVYEYDPEACRVLVAAVALTGLMAGLLRLALHRALPAAPPLLSVGVALLALILVAQAFRTGNPASASASLTRHLGGVLVLLALAASPDLRARLTKLLPALIPIVTGAVAAAGIAGQLGRFPGPIFGQTTEFPASLFINSNYGGTFAALLLPLSIGAYLAARRPWHQVINAVGLTLLCCYLFLSRSRIGWIGAAAALLSLAVLWIWRNRRTGTFLPRKRVLTVPLLALAGLLPGYLLLRADHRESLVQTAVDPDTLNQRIEVWRSSLGLCLRHPLTGVGLANYPAAIAPVWAEEFMSRQPEPWAAIPQISRDPHSTYVEFLVELGPLGLAALLALFVVCAISFLRSWHDSTPMQDELWTWAWFGVAVAAVVSGLTNSLCDYASHSFYEYAALGMIAGFGVPGGPARRIPRVLALGASGLLATGFAGAALLQGTHFPAHYLRAQYEREGGVRDELIERARRLHPWRPEDLLNLADALESVGKFKLAAEQIQGALSVEPSSPYSWARLGNARFQSGQAEEARTAYRRAGELAPSWPYPQLQLAALDLHSARLNAAVRGYQDLLRKWPSLPAAHYYLGKSLALLKDDRRALEEFRTADRLGFPVASIFRLESEPWKLRPDFSEFLDK